MSVWKHDELAADLACYLRGPERMVWTDMQIGPAGSPRPDVFTIQRSYSKPRPAAFEVKISRSDFRSDTTKGKWQSYLAFAGSVTFAVPDGLIQLSEVPDACGLMVRKDQVWRYVRKPTIQRVTLTEHAWMKLLLDGRSREFVPEQPRSRRIDLWRDDERIRKRFGAAVALAARDLVQAQSQIDNLKGLADRESDRIKKHVEVKRLALMESAKRDAAVFEEAKQEIVAWLGLDARVDAWNVRQKIAALRASCDADARVRDADHRLGVARRSIQHAIETLNPKEIAA